MESLSLKTSDVLHHLVEVGLDVYPPIDIPAERTRLNMFYEELRHRWAKLADRFQSSDTSFRISKDFREKDIVQGPASVQDTFVLTNRGPVFRFPLKLPPPIGETGLEKAYVDDFIKLRGLFHEMIPGHNMLRVGLVRDILFDAGQTPCNQIITHLQSFCGAHLSGGQFMASYRDEKYNHHILIEPVKIMQTTLLPVGKPVSKNTGYGVHVRLDVNNWDLQTPLGDDDVQQVIDRATSLWPEKLLEYIQESTGGRES